MLLKFLNTPEARTHVGQLIKSDHPYAFRSGQWGEIKAVIDINGRDCYYIEWPAIDPNFFPVQDFWPVFDDPANYQFKDK